MTHQLPEPTEDQPLTEEELDQAQGGKKGPEELVEAPVDPVGMTRRLMQQ